MKTLTILLKQKTSYPINLNKKKMTLICRSSMLLFKPANGLFHRNVAKVFSSTMATSGRFQGSSAVAAVPNHFNTSSNNNNNNTMPVTATTNYVEFSTSSSNADTGTTNLMTDTQTMSMTKPEFHSTQKGTITRTLKQLGATDVRKIESELREVDTNGDGRIDTEELTSLLKKHNSAFTDEEILEFAELFYAGKAGGSVTIQDFIEVLDNIAAGDEKKNGVHPILDGNCSVEYIYRKSHAYAEDDLNIALTHREPTTVLDNVAFNAVKLVRSFFDTATGWNYNTITKGKILNRVIFLETIAAVPGMVAAIVRHFKSLRRMERDGGLLHLFLEEANNERMHLLSFIKMKDPSTAFRAAVIFSQFGFGSVFLLSYLANPQFCHRFVGYIEEEACTTYTKIIDAIEAAPEQSDLAQWKYDVAPSIARSYWKLGETGTVLDLMYAVRADEAEHRDVNHACSELQHGITNPFNDPETKVTIMLRKYIKDVMSREDRLTATA